MKLLQIEYLRFRFPPFFFDKKLFVFVWNFDIYTNIHVIFQISKTYNYF